MKPATAEPATRISDSNSVAPLPRTIPSDRSILCYHPSFSFSFFSFLSFLPSRDCFVDLWPTSTTDRGSMTARWHALSETRVAHGKYAKIYFYAWPPCTSTPLRGKSFPVSKVATTGSPTITLVYLWPLCKHL